jgi:energy-coupling factor transporter ATP-binding protein EcfA2
MPRVQIERTSEIRTSGRVLQLRSLFDVQPEMGRRVAWDLDIPIDDKPWGVGLIVGPSGSGKSTIAGELFGSRVVRSFDWPADRSIVDAFPDAMPTDQVAGLLTSVGFGSVPDWLRPFHVLSTGQQFRATLARALADGNGLVCVDEFTSVVDRQVAQVCSAAVAKACRRMGRPFVAVTCHYDVEPWLDPDWVLDMGTGMFSWRSVQGRPRVAASVVESSHQGWGLFKQHHYLTDELNPSANCYVAMVEDRPIAFVAMRYQPLSSAPSWMVSRLVTLPEWQGIGVGMRLLDHIAEVYQRRPPHRVRIGTRAPGLVAALDRSPRWRCVRSMSATQQAGKSHRAKDLIARMGKAGGRGEVIAVFEWRA